MQLTTENAEEKFCLQGATRCVVIPDPKAITLDDVMNAIAEAVIVNDDEGGDDSYVVRIADSPQQALELDQLTASIGESAWWDRRE